METLKYKVIKNKTQYNQYCNQLEDLLTAENVAKDQQAEIDLLTLLIHSWDERHNTFRDIEPIPLLISLIKERGTTRKELLKLLNISKSHLSEILNYKKSLSKEIIRKLSSYFKISQEALNRAYVLRVSKPTRSKKAISKKRQLQPA
jgi:HTH-type transcriptional regulator/antitoxin HigA